MASSQSSQTDNLVNCKLTLECLTSNVGLLTFKCIYCNNLVKNYQRDSKTLQLCDGVPHPIIFFLKKPPAKLMPLMGCPPI